MIFVRRNGSYRKQGAVSTRFIVDSGLREDLLGHNTSRNRNAQGMRPASLWSKNGRGLRGEDVVLVVIPAIVLVLRRLALLRSVSGCTRANI